MHGCELAIKIKNFRKFLEISLFPVKYFRADIFHFFTKLGYWVDGWELAIKSKHFWNFLQTSYFGVQWFRADFLQFFRKKRLTLSIGWTAKIQPSNRNISGIFLKFLNFLCNVLELFLFLFFSILFQQTSKFGYWEDGCKQDIKSKHFRNFFHIS